MNLKRHFGEALTLAAAAALCAVVANAFARSERKLPLFGTYPNALKVPEKKTEISSKAEEAAAAVPPAAPATAAIPKATPAAPAAAKLPLEEKRPDPRVKSTAAAPVPTPAREQRDPLLSRFPPHGKPFVEISGDDAAWLVARGVLVVDARRTKDYVEGHVALARNISPWEGDADARITALVNEGRDGAVPVVVYCSGGDCEDSHMLAQRLFGGGFNNLLVYRDGWPDWVKRGGKSAAGPEPAAP